VCGPFSDSAILLHIGESPEIVKHKFTWKRSDMSEKIELQSKVDDTSHTEKDGATDDSQAHVHKISLWSV